MASRRPGAAWRAQCREEGRYVIERPTRGHDAARQGDGVVRFELRRAHPSTHGVELTADQASLPAHDDKAFLHRPFYGSRKVNTSSESPEVRRR